MTKSRSGFSSTSTAKAVFSVPLNYERVESYQVYEMDQTSEYYIQERERRAAGEDQWKSQLHEFEKRGKTLKEHYAELKRIKEELKEVIVNENYKRAEQLTLAREYLDVGIIEMKKLGCTKNGGVKQQLAERNEILKKVEKDLFMAVKSEQFQDAVVLKEERDGHRAAIKEMQELYAKEVIESGSDTDGSEGPAGKNVAAGIEITQLVDLQV